MSFSVQRHANFILISACVIRTHSGKRSFDSGHWSAYKCALYNIILLTKVSTVRLGEFCGHRWSIGQIESEYMQIGQMIRGGRECLVHSHEKFEVEEARHWVAYQQRSSKKRSFFKFQSSLSQLFFFTQKFRPPKTIFCSYIPAAAALCCRLNFPRKELNTAEMQTMCRPGITIKPEKHASQWEPVVSFLEV